MGWVGSVYVYVPNVDTVYARAMELGARSISELKDKPYNERQAGFVDVGGNTWWCLPTSVTRFEVAENARPRSHR